MRATKKELEEAILKAVYDSRIFSFQRSERPDFVLQHSGQADFTFGVEVTEHFETESDARVVRLDGYVSDLLEGQPHRHKDDVDVLRQVHVDIQGKDGERVHSKVPAILKELPPLSEYLGSLQRAVGVKESAVRTYDRPDLAHVNLIVLDHGSRLQIGDGSNLFRYLGRGDFKEMVLDSHFREIFLVTEVEEQRVVVFPLKQLFTVSDIHMFFRALEDFDHPQAPTELDDGFRLFGAWYESQARSVGIQEAADSGVVVYYGNCGFTYGEESFHIRDYQDRPFPTTEPLMVNDRERQFLEAFKPVLKTFIATHVFEFAASYDVVTMPPLRR